MTPRQNQGAGKRNAPAVPLDYYDSKLEKRTPNLFFVFHGGAVTEKKYFEGLRTDLASKTKGKSQFVHLKFVHQAPKQTVEQTVKFVSEEVKKRQQKGTESTDGDIIWVVFDKDDFKENYSLAISLADQHRIKVAYSNECFALWLLLHFQEQTSAIGRGQLEEFLRKTWEETKGKPIDNKRTVKHFPYGIVRTHGDQAMAIERAKSLLAQAEEECPQSPWEVNPVTTVYALVEQLIAFFAE
jgi:hypothetical protein